VSFKLLSGEGCAAADVQTMGCMARNRLTGAQQRQLNSKMRHTGRLHRLECCCCKAAARSGCGSQRLDQLAQLIQPCGPLPGAVAPPLFLPKHVNIAPPPLPPPLTLPTPPPPTLLLTDLGWCHHTPDHEVLAADLRDLALKAREAVSAAAHPLVLHRHLRTNKALAH